MSAYRFADREAVNIDPALLAMTAKTMPMIAVATDQASQRGGFGYASTAIIPAANKTQLHAQPNLAALPTWYASHQGDGIHIMFDMWGAGHHRSQRLYAESLPLCRAVGPASRPASVDRLLRLSHASKLGQIEPAFGVINRKLEIPLIAWNVVSLLLSIRFE
jgi:hypothetical protein